MSKCSHPLCTGKHSGRWCIAELCPLAQEKRRASWRAYDGHLREAYRGSCAARLKNPSVKLDMRSQRRARRKRIWALCTAKGVLCQVRANANRRGNR
jgi:hypothetical protein